MTNRPVRVRFAPSPTGYFHVGGAKTSLYNWIFARQQGGTFVLRIEDTDAERNKPEWIEGIQSAMRWLVSGLDEAPWDEGPYFQSDNAGKHLAAAQKLLADGRAYYCDCTRDDVKARAGSEHAGYDGFCRTRGLEAGEGRALRFRTPDEGVTRVVDVIRDNPEFPNDHIEDFIILRGNGSPMFLLANVVDDMDMGITHVIRAEEHLPNTPKAQMLWEALDGGPLPTFAHVPLLVNEKRQKLSKRRDPVALEMYRDQGFLPEAMRNFLLLAGWSPGGDDEVVPWSQIMEKFRLEDVNSSPAFFDVTKLTAINGEYIRALPVEEFIERVAPWVPEEQRLSPEFTAMAGLVQERIRRLDEVPSMIGFLFGDTVEIDEKSWAKVSKGPAAEMLDGVIAAYGEAAWDAATLKTAVEQVGEAHGLKPSKAQAPIRVAITGLSVGPPLYESVAILGRERTLARLRTARALLDA